MKEAQKHDCSYNSVKHEGSDVAAEGCFEDDGGFLWIANCEYANTVNFCPFCGYKAKKVGATDEIKENKQKA